MGIIVLRSRAEMAYLGDKEAKLVHFLPSEKDQCQIDKIFAEGNAVAFSPDTLKEAHKTGWTSCRWCIGISGL